MTDRYMYLYKYALYYLKFLHWPFVCIELTDNEFTSSLNERPVNCCWGNYISGSLSVMNTDLKGQCLVT